MHLKFKKAHLVVLGVTSLMCSRTFFALMNDPKGPNLLIVVVLALVIYLVSIATYVYYLPAKLNSLNKLIASLFIQVVCVSGLYLLL